MNRSQSARAGFSLVELLVVVAIVVVLIALLIPGLRSVKAKAHETVCRSNLNQIGVSARAFINDRDREWFHGNASKWRGWGIDSTHARRRIAMGLAHLPDNGTLASGDARVFYCPAWKHPYGQFDTLDTEGLDLVGGKNAYGGWPLDNKTGPTAHRIISYRYRASFGPGRNEPPPRSPAYPAGTAIVADHFTQREVYYGVEYGHGDRYGTLFMDGHVEFKMDTVDYMLQVNTHYSHGNWGLQEQIWRDFFDGNPRYNAE